MGVMDKFLNYMKLNDNEDEYYDNDFLDDDEADEAPAPKKPFVSKPSANDDYDDEEPAPARRPPRAKARSVRIAAL